MKKIIKRLINYKSIFLKGEKTNRFIHYSAEIKNFKNIVMSKNSYIRKSVKINIKNGKLILRENSAINLETNIYIESGDLDLGKNSYINNNSNIIVLGDILIGNNVMIGPMCNIVSGNHKISDLETNIVDQGYMCKTIKINDNVWIGCGSIILAGVTIGSGAVIGAGSVVTKDVGENEIWAGNPAKFIKNR